MPETVWYRSLYWRIGIGFVVLLAVLLGAQGVAFLYLTGRASELWPGRSPAEFAQVLAADVGSALETEPSLDIEGYLNDRYTGGYRSFAVAMRSGEVYLSRRVTPPSVITRAARGRLFDNDGRSSGRRGRGGASAGADAAPERGAAAGEGRQGTEGAPRLPSSGPGNRRGGGRGRGGPGGQTFTYAPVMVAGATVGMVAVPVDPPPLSVALRDFGPVLAAVALALLAVGTSVAALVVFRPARQRIGALQQAARAVGQGRSDVRAPESGGDEVASLARAFNDMAAGLEQRSHALAAADRTRRQLLADVSHELMTPLSAIRGYVETLSMASLALDDPTRQRYLAIVSDETERLEHLIGDLLDLARLEGGGGALEAEAVSFADLLDRVRSRHEPTLADKLIDLDVGIDGDLPVVLGDQHRLEQAIQNLVTNAIRHTPRAGRISVRARAVGADVALTVDDSGPGIPAEHLPHVFDRFYKADTSRAGTSLPSGSGLGLSIVQAIVERHGGTVTAENRADGGARFRITLPAVLNTTA